MGKRIRLAACVGAAGIIGAAAVAPQARAQAPHVLLVGPAGTAGAQFTSIQDAVDHAVPGDWILVAPGVYHEKGSDDPRRPAGVIIRTPDIHLRGMNRDSVIVDGAGTRGAQAAGTSACSSSPAAQDPGVKDLAGNLHVREGIEVYRTSGVSIENLSACNYLDNEIWWNNGDGSGVSSPMAIHGDYITATSTYYKDANTQSAQYGIFTSNEGGPGLIEHAYSNNMTDSAYYVGACRNCDMTLDHVHAENSALGLSSTNAGGNFVVENSEWDLNRTGLVSNAQNNDDAPSPQLGQCVAPSTPPPGATSCTVWRHNDIHDNNNPNTPGSGLTAVSAVGAGIELVATQHISVVDNDIHNQGAWGVVAHDLPDPEQGIANCNGGLPIANPAQYVCLYFSRGNDIGGNRFSNNGGFGGLTNGDMMNAQSGLAAPPQAPELNCFHDNTDSSGSVSQWPPALQTVCPSPADSTVGVVELLCATGFTKLFVPGLTCPQSQLANYPQHDGNCQAPAVLTPAGDKVNGVCFLPLTYTLSAAVSPPMPDPCAGVPANAYCSSGDTATTTTSPALAATTSATTGGAAAMAALSALALAAGSSRRRRAAL